MAYFSYVPDIQWDTKPISYPFSKSDYVTAKNFFRRYQINEKVFDSAVYYTEYAVEDGERPDMIAKKFYDSPFLDWVVLLTNNIVNPLFQWPMSEYELRKYVEKTYDDPYNGIHHYETITKEDQLSVYGQVIIEPGLIVDEYFYNSKGSWFWENPPIPIPDSNLPVITQSSVAEVMTLVDFSDINAYDSETQRFIDSEDPVTIQPGGTGTGTTGGFNIGPHLLFGGTSSPRYALLNPINLTNVNSFTLKAIRGNGLNGGETPDILNSEELEICFFNGIQEVLTSRGGWTSANSNVWDNWVTGLPQENFSTAIPTASNSGDPLDNNVRDWVINIPESRRTNDIYILFRQKSSSGPTFDYYGLKSIEYTAQIQVSNTPNLNDTTLIFDSNSFTYRYESETNSWYPIKAVINNDVYLWSFDYGSDEYRWGRRAFKGYTYYDQKDNSVKTVPGNDVSFPVKQFNYESERNEKNRQIFLLKPEYVSLFVDEFRRRNLYKRSGDFVTERLKKTGI